MVCSGSAFLRLSSQISRAVSDGAPARLPCVDLGLVQPLEQRAGAHPQAAGDFADRSALGVVITGMVTGRPDRLALTSYLAAVV